MRAHITIATCLCLVAVIAVSPPASAQQTVHQIRQDEPLNDEALPSPSVAEDLRSANLGPGWDQSRDMAWTTSGDATGFHILIARAQDGYTWRTVASLSEPGFDTDMWIGNTCLTGSGDRMAVVYAPRTFTNRPDLFDRGGFTAVVDLRTGDVDKLPIMSTLAYFNPGCGVGERVVVSQGSSAADEADSGPVRTRLTVVDTSTEELSEPIVATGQLTSALPGDDGIVAVSGSSLVWVNESGEVDEFAEGGATPFRVTADVNGGIVYHEQTGSDRVEIRRVMPGDGTSPVTLAEGELGEVRVTAGSHGQVFLTGDPDWTRSLPNAVTQLNVPSSARMSTQGEIAVTETIWFGRNDPKVSMHEPDMSRPVRIKAHSLVTGAVLEFGVTPAAPKDQAQEVHPSLGHNDDDAIQDVTVDWVTPSPVDEDRWCSVPRNARTFMVLQPKPRQVEWAINQAATDSLYVERPINWMGLGMGSYQPQEMFPPIALDSGGRVHSQIMLGIAAQESNMWQATRLAYPGMTGNPLIGNYHGLDIYNQSEDDDWDIDWSDADCGYGVMQVTDGMRLAGHEKPGETALPWEQQQAIAADFAANIAAGLRILQTKWNQTRSAGLIVGNGDPSGLENWYFALWAYNTGFHPESEQSQHSGAWGVGWANNPINPHYPADRPPFMETSYADAAHPQDWPYQEKVIGFAGHPLDYIEDAQPDEYTYVAGFRPAWWTTVEHRTQAKAPNETFCTESNDCFPGEEFDPPPGDDEPWLKTPCAHKDASGSFDLKCWWHEPTEWKSDPDSTGRELLRFDPGYEYQEDGRSFPPACRTDVHPELPPDALVIDDMPKALPPNRSNCGPGFEEAGMFVFTIPEDEAGTHRAAIDLHQLSSGFNSHFWFAHTRNSDNDHNGTMRMEGTWRFNEPLHGWGRVLVHVPSVAAHTQQARYDIDLGAGFDNGAYRVILQRTREHRWVSLGAFPFDGVPKVRLANFTHDGTGDEDIAWDAAAIQPLPGKPTHQIVSLGDSYSSGEGAYKEDQFGYDPETDFKLVINDEDRYQNACHRSVGAWSRLAVLPDSEATIALRDGRRDVDMDHHLLACSGAESENMLPYHAVPPGEPIPENGFGENAEDGDFGGRNNSELSQLDRGFLDENTTLVTLSIGGNDARFGDVLPECINPLKSDPCMDTTLEGDDTNLRDATTARIDGPIRASIITVLEEIHIRAPNAQIMLMGYPALFYEEVIELEECNLIDFGLTEEEKAWLNEIAFDLSDMFASIAAELRLNHNIPVWHADPIETFANHGVCTHEEGIHSIVIGKTRGESSGNGFWDFVGNVVSQQSFHPNSRGGVIYSHVMVDSLGRMG